MDNELDNFEAFEEQDSEREMFEHYRFVCDPGQKPVRVDKFLQNRMQNASRTKIQTAAEAGNVLVDDKAVKSSYKIKAGETISLIMDYPRQSSELIPEDIPLEVVFEDNDLLVINKPPGMVVHPGYGHFDGTLVHALVHRYKGLEMFDNNDGRPGLVHRIDKDTSGLLLIAKNELARMKLAKQFFDKVTYRRYNALVWGTFDKDEGTVFGNIGRNLINRKVMDIFPDGDHGKYAVTHYKVLEKLGYVTLIECRLETGRTHQIRAHMKHIGHPIFSDEMYGGNKILKGTTFSKYRQFVENCFQICPRQALHAKSIGFYHPITGEYHQYESELPEDMTLLIEKWRTYIGSREDNEG